MLRAFDAGSTSTGARPVPYGDDALPDLPGAAFAGVVAVFNLTATPERENHGAFVAALAEVRCRARAARRRSSTRPISATASQDPRRSRRARGGVAAGARAARRRTAFVRLAEPDLEQAGDVFADDDARAAD